MKITVQDISKSFGANEIFSHFSLEVDNGVRLCVCGPNGTGKSTFLRILAGKEDCDSGRILLPRGCRLGYVEQELSPEALDTPLLGYVLDALHSWTDFWTKWEEADRAGDQKTLESLMHEQAELERMYGYNPEQRAQKVLSGLGFAESRWHRKLSELSGGWQERAKLARVLTEGADVLLLDEPTNHLDIDAVEWLEEFLLSFEGALVFVAHDRRFMDVVGNHVLYLGLSKPVFRRTNYSHFLDLQNEYNAQRRREAEALQDELSRKMAFVERFRAKATKARQASSHQKMAKKLEKQLEDYRPEPKRKELRFYWPEAPHVEKIVVAASELDFHFPDGKYLWPPLTFTLYRGMRVALVGHNGCGKSTLIKVLSGNLQKTGGSISQAQQMRMGYYSQHQMDLLRSDSTVLGEIRRLSDPHTTEEELMSVLGLFLLGERYFDRAISLLSGGEKCRLVLASLFLKRCNFLLLDEPTNHLDLESREALLNALNQYTGTLLMIAHDRWLLTETHCEAWLLNEQGITVFENYEKYDAMRHAELPKEEQPVQTIGTRTPTISREDQKRLRREQAEKRNTLHRKLRPLQEAYTRQEEELNRILELQGQVEEDLADPEIYADHAKSQELLKQFEEYRSRSETLMDRMGALEEQIEALKAEFSTEPL